MQLTILQLEKLASIQDKIPHGWTRDERVPCFDGGLIVKEGNYLTEDGLRKVERFKENRCAISKGLPLDIPRVDLAYRLQAEDWRFGKVNGGFCWFNGSAIFWTRAPEAIRARKINAPDELSRDLNREVTHTIHDRALTQIYPICLQQCNLHDELTVCFSDVNTKQNCPIRITRIFARYYDQIIADGRDVTWWRRTLRDREDCAVVVRLRVRNSKTPTTIALINQALAPKWPDPTID